MSFLVVLRALAKGENLERILSHLSFSKYSQISFERLKEVKDFRSFKDLIKGTNYYRALETYHTIDTEDLFSIEKTMERAYYDLLYKRVKQLGSKEKKLVKLLRMEIDLLNILWLYRAKRFYKLKADEIIPYIYRGGYFINEVELAKLASIDEFSDFLKELKSYKQYDFLFAGSDEEISLKIERRAKRFLYSKYQELSYFGKSLSTAYAYLRLLEYEASDIISIIEGKRYDLEPEQMKEYLIHTV